MQYESLHNHTIISDGQLTHLQLLDVAAQYGFGLVVFTDHDILPDGQILEQLRRYDGPIRWEVGIEVSSGWPKEVGGGAANMFHILGLGVDPRNTELLTYCRLAAKARTERFEQTARNLQKAGFKIKLDRAKAIAGPGNPGSPHITQALLENTANVERIHELAKEMKRAGESDKALHKAYINMMRRYKKRHLDPSQLVYPLLLAASAFVEGIHVPYLYSMGMDEVVRTLRGAGGVAVLAHPTTVKDTIDTEMLGIFLRDNRLDGLEYRSGFVDEPGVETSGEMLRALAARHRRLATIGIDAHETADFKRFLELEGLAEQTIGQWRQVEQFTGLTHQDAVQGASEARTEPYI